MDAPERATRVLVAEDEPHIRRTLSFILEKEMLEVLVASDGEEALATALREKPDLILMDVMMPKRDGISVLQALRRTDGFEALPVILLTALSEARDKVKAFEFGADDYLTKPFNPREVVARVHAQLRIRKMQDELLRAERDRVALATAGAAAHEMSQPLTVMMGTLQLLQGRLEESHPHRRLVDKILENGDKAVTHLRRLQSVQSYTTKPYLDGQILDLVKSSAENGTDGDPGGSEAGE